VWTSTDPAGQDFNPYAYCNGNPVILIDQNGELWEWIGMGIGAAAGWYSSGVMASGGEWNPGKWNGGAWASSILGGISGGLTGYGIGSRIDAAVAAGTARKLGDAVQIHSNKDITTVAINEKKLSELGINVREVISADKISSTGYLQDLSYEDATKVMNLIEKKTGLSSSQLGLFSVKGSDAVANYAVKHPYVLNPKSSYPTAYWTYTGDIQGKVSTTDLISLRTLNKSVANSSNIFLTRSLNNEIFDIGDIVGLSPSTNPATLGGFDYKGILIIGVK
jgi:hypothetical protein